MLIDVAQNVGLKIQEILRNTELRLSQKIASAIEFMTRIIYHTLTNISHWCFRQQNFFQFATLPCLIVGGVYQQGWVCEISLKLCKERMVFRSLIKAEPNNKNLVVISPLPPKIRSRPGGVHNLKCLQEDFTTLTDLKKSHKRNVSFWYQILTVQMLNTVFPPKSA